MVAYSSSEVETAHKSLQEPHASSPLPAMQASTEDCTLVRKQAKYFFWGVECLSTLPFPSCCQKPPTLRDSKKTFATFNPLPNETQLHSIVSNF